MGCTFCLSSEFLIYLHNVQILWETFERNTEAIHLQFYMKPADKVCTQVVHRKLQFLVVKKVTEITG